MLNQLLHNWNPLNSSNNKEWQPVDGLEDITEELTLSIDAITGEYTRLTRVQIHHYVHKAQTKEPITYV